MYTKTGYVPLTRVILKVEIELVVTSRYLIDSQCLNVASLREVREGLCKAFGTARRIMTEAIM